MFSNVRTEVYNRTDGKQVPWENTSIIGKFYFKKEAKAPLSSTKDSDGDGLVDSADKCPFEKGSIAQDGCPDRDSDNDGVLDKYDGCPTKKGPTSNNGCPETDSGTFIDNRDGQSYAWKKMKDGKKWMTKNLNYKIADSYCYDDEESNCRKYGRLYTWVAAKKACPSGWRLPSDKEWNSFLTAYGGYWSYSGTIGDPKLSYKSLISGSSSGFAALLGGGRSSNGEYNNLSSLGYYWSATENSADSAWGYFFNKGFGKVGRYNYYKASAFSCRCLKD